MKKINIVGEIGWDVMAFEIDDQLKSANGVDIDFLFNTPGGFISEGNLIDDLILSYKKDFPQAQIMATVIEAQSYGSYLLSNPAFDLIVARTNSVVMIHNPLQGIIGDYKELKKTADVLERKAAMFAERYSERMKKTTAEIRIMMDEETFFIGGKEIVEAGLADEVITDKESLQESSTLRAKAETRLETLKIKIKNTKDDFEKIAAMSKDKIEPKLTSIKPAPGGEKIQEDITVKDSNELKEKFPEIHAETMKAGSDREKTARTERVKALLEMKSKDDFKNIPDALDRIDEGILKDESVQAVELGLFAILRSPGVKAAMDSADIGAINPGQEHDTVSKEKGKAKSTAGEF